MQPFSFQGVVAADRAASKRFVLIDVSRNTRGAAVPSLERLKRKIAKCLTNDTKHRLASTKLYIVGEWNCAEPKEELSEVNWTNFGTGLRLVLIEIRIKRHSLRRETGRKGSN